MLTRNQRIKLTTLFLDIVKTLGSAFFIWALIKSLFPLSGEHENSREFLIILTMFSYISAIILSIQLADIEDEVE